MKKLLLIVLLIVGCEESTGPDTFEEDVPIPELTCSFNIGLTEYRYDSPDIYFNNLLTNVGDFTIYAIEFTSCMLLYTHSSVDTSIIENNTVINTTIDVINTKVYELQNYQMDFLGLPIDSTANIETYYVATDADGMINDIDDADSLKVIYRYQKVIF